MRRYRAGVPGVDAASSVFARNSTLLLLFTRLQWDAAGEPLIPGGLDVWQRGVRAGGKAHHSHNWTSRFHVADGGEGFLEAQAAYSNI